MEFNLKGCLKVKQMEEHLCDNLCGGGGDGGGGGAALD